MGNEWGGTDVDREGDEVRRRWTRRETFSIESFRLVAPPTASDDRTVALADRIDTSLSFLPVEDANSSEDFSCRTRSHIPRRIPALGSTSDGIGARARSRVKDFPTLAEEDLRRTNNAACLTTSTDDISLRFEESAAARTTTKTTNSDRRELFLALSSAIRSMSSLREDALPTR